MKVSQTYATPHFTRANQFEGGINAGILGFNSYLTYSPLKYFAIQANGFYYPGSFYNIAAEGGAGFYLPYKRSAFAINFGYGQADCKWALSDPRGHSGYTLDRLSFYSENTFLHAYYSLKGDSTNRFYSGVSFKFSDSADHYRYGSAEANSSSGFPHLHDATYYTQSYEFTYFQKAKIARGTFFSLNTGFRYTDSSPTDVLGIILRIGLVFKF